MSTKERSSADYTREVESPFLDQELFVGGGEGEWEPRAATLAGESPFQTAFEQDRLRIDPPEMEEPESFDEKLFSEEEPFVSQYESEDEEENEELDRGVGEYSAPADFGGSEEEFSEAEDTYPEEDEFLYESADSSPAIQAGQLLQLTEREHEGSEGRRQETCRKRWLKFRDGLPQQVKDALDKLDFKLAIAYAVHHGIRNIKDLTNMLFYTQYGLVHGYCRIKKGTRIPGGGDRYDQTWVKIRNTMVLPTLARPSPLVSQIGPVICTRRENRLAEPSPDKPQADITGRYEQLVGAFPGATPGFTFRINQAGKHIECIFTHVLLPSAKSQRREARRFHGELQADGSFFFFDRTKPTFYGQLKPDGKTMLVSIESRPDTVVEVEPGPTLLEGALGQLPERHLIRLYEWFPLTQPQIQHLVNKLASDKIVPYLKNFFSQSGGEKSYEKNYRYKAAKQLNDYLYKVFNDPEYGVHVLDLDLAQFYARAILTRNTWKLTYTKSQLDWIQFILSRVDLDKTGELIWIPEYLRLQHLSNTSLQTTHTYKVDLTLKGAGYFVHGWWGTITIEKTTGDKWTHNFSIWFLALEAGGGIKISDSLSGIAHPSFEWKQPDFPGRVMMGKLEAGGSGGPAKASVQGGFMHIHGRGYLPPMEVLFAEGSIDVELPFEIDKDSGKRKPRFKGFDVSFGPGAAIGEIRDQSFPDVDYSTFQVKSDYAVTYELTKDVHFCLDSALLTEDARQALRIMCANELPALMSPTSHLTIYGHTDRSASNDYNLKLSVRRAKNTKQAIEDILGVVKFGIPEKQIICEGKGEAEAEKDPEEVNPKYRRVDIILNARLVLTLKAE